MSDKQSKQAEVKIVFVAKVVVDGSVIMEQTVMTIQNPKEQGE
mgnify:CR=1 FL=1